MTPLEYRAKAARHLRLAQDESDPVRKAEHLQLAYSYTRLAEQAEKNAGTDVVYETPPRPQADQPAQQQQQQIQPKPEGE